ncbi:General transcription factor 3C polypeptide 3 [Bienertia sinuspersici]
MGSRGGGYCAGYKGGFRDVGWGGGVTVVLGALGGVGLMTVVTDGFRVAISLLNEVVWLAPNLPDPYHTLGLIYKSMGDEKKSVDYYRIAADVGPRDSPLWKLLVTWSIEQGNIDQADRCIDKAIKFDPADVTLWYHRASIYMVRGDYSKAAESYDRIVQICPDNVEALKTAATDYLNKHPSESDLTVVDMLALSLMESITYTKALHHIEHAKSLWFHKGVPIMSQGKRRHLSCSSWKYGESGDLFQSPAEGKCGKSAGLDNGSG